MPAKQSRQFCVNGHDTYVFGRGVRSSCRECQRLFYHKPDKKQNHRIGTCNKNWQISGIKNENGEQFTFVDYDRLYQIQSGKCHICGKHSTEFKRNLAVDHNHVNGKVRSLVCCPCNQTIIGANTIQTVAILAEYLRHHAAE